MNNEQFNELKVGDWVYYKGLDQIFDYGQVVKLRYQHATIENKIGVDIIHKSKIVTKKRTVDNKIIKIK